MLTLREAKESFKTAFSSEPLLSGERYMFQIKLVKGCNFKIGVSTNRENPEVAFCDSDSGYGFYSAGQLRNGSKTSGKKYGESFKGTINQDIISVYLDLIDGRLIFAKNGEVFPTAFSGPEFLNNDFYAACCCLTKNESFELLLP